MKTKYLSHAQACAINRDYQYLHGERFDDTNRIDLVTVAPYSRILQWQFVHGLLYEGKQAAAMAAKNPTGRYDVIVVTKTTEDRGFLIRDLRTHLLQKGIPFDESRYSCLRSQSIPMATLKEILG